MMHTEAHNPSDKKSSRTPGFNIVSIYLGCR